MWTTSSQSRTAQCAISLRRASSSHQPICLVEPAAAFGIILRSPATTGCSCLPISGLGDRMGSISRYERYTTTVLGAHSVPRWFEALVRLVTAGQLAPADLADAQLRTSQAAILEQEIAGIDVVTGGELDRRTHNRHAPPNA